MPDRKRPPDVAKSVTGWAQNAIGPILDTVTSAECANHFTNAGHDQAQSHSALIRGAQRGRSTLRAPSAQTHERRVAPKPISTFISLETGQSAFAFAAIDWNVAWSMPGIFAVTVR